MNEPKIETVRFPNGHEALLAHVDQDTPANAVIAALKLPQPNALACLNGGTAELSDDLKADLSRLLADGLARVAAEYAITLLTGGTDAGIFSLLGDGLAKWERKAPCIGVTPAAPVTWPGREKGDTPLEPHHSHFVVVEGKEWGDETRTMYSVAQALGRDCSLHCRIRWWRRRDLARDAGQRGSRPRDDLGRGQRPQDGRGAGHPRRLEYVRQSASGDRVKRQDHSFRNRWVSGAIRATG
jgi:SLOG in TRPM, prokaryote